jgi:hypothetical protein
MRTPAAVGYAILISTKTLWETCCVLTPNLEMIPLASL